LFCRKKSIAEGNFPTQCQAKEYLFFVSLLGIVPRLFACEAFFRKPFSKRLKAKKALQHEVLPFFPRLFFKGKKGFCEAIFPKAFCGAKRLFKLLISYIIN
jgi:hypothetical protein